jgi:hypothetical protein
MRALSVAFAASTVIALLVPPASADGERRVWRRAHSYGVGEITRNVITPYYVGYYGSHYSYYRPDPVPPPVYWDYPGGPACWAWGYYGHRLFIC